MLLMRIIAHLDMDAFFASVEERDRPRLKGRPIVVGADPKEGHGRGVVSTANYKAREYGIHSAMPISNAWRLGEEARKKGKPEVVFLSGDFKNYGEVSVRIMNIIRAYAPLVEEAGIDEAYFDLSFSGSYEKAEEICRKIKTEIKRKEKLTASCGIGPNKLIAKISSDMQKPDGLTVIREEDVDKFLEPLPIRKIQGIGPKTEVFFHRKGARTVHDLKKFSQNELEDMLGKWGAELYGLIRGIDHSPVKTEYEIKSIGEQETFEKDTRDTQFIMGRLKVMCRQIIQSLHKSDFKKFRTISISVRFADFETKTRAHTLKEPKGDSDTLEFEAARLLFPFFDKRENPKSKLFRLIGVRIEKLV